VTQRDHRFQSGGLPVSIELRRDLSVITQTM